ncbi:MAG: gamma-glutamyltransferase family protein [Terriglobia bacterium]
MTGGEWLSTPTGVFILPFFEVDHGVMLSSQESPQGRPQIQTLEGREIICKQGAVATGPAAAARVGAEILSKGGNAMDAAAAASLACAVLEPESVDLGGYVFCAVVREARTDKVWSLDANSVAPHRASDRMFQVLPAQPGMAGINEAEYDCSVHEDANVYGPLAIAVPGFIAGLGTMWERWGQLRWSEIVAPSERLIAEGFSYGPTAAAIARRLTTLRRFDLTRQHLMSDGTPPRAQDIWRRPGLETTLRILSTHGWREFYSGGLGLRIANYVSEAGGILDAEDMANFAPRVEPAYEISYRGHAIFASALPSGSLSSLQILKMLECFSPAPVEDTPGYWHRLAEVMKLAWQDRLRYFGDPDFSKVPIERLLTTDYAEGRTATLQQFPESLGPQDPRPALPAPPGTIHVSAADSQGNIVSATISQGLPFGSCVTVPETGIILGHGMCRFDPRPGRPNSIAPGKRPLSNIAPLILSLPDREVALGTRGGRPIINICAQFIQRMVDGSQSPAQALSAPRLYVGEREPMEFLEFNFTRSVSKETLDELTALGHRVLRKPSEVEGAGAAHCAEYLKTQNVVRATGDTWAAGV